jgi:UDP-N-acetylglucosamine:LPS N-acetylglucosamine transferase
MSMSQVLIGKAGASSTMEALYLKKPHILIDYIWARMQYWQESDMTCCS